MGRTLLIRAAPSPLITVAITFPIGGKDSADSQRAGSAARTAPSRMMVRYVSASTTCGFRKVKVRVIGST
jgi:hypothetical protein